MSLPTQAAQRVVEDKIVHFLTSNNHASDYPTQANGRHMLEIECSDVDG